MSGDVLTCEAGESVNRAAQLMWEHRCGSVAVVDSSQRVVGSLTDRDACTAAYTQGKALRAIPIATAMSKTLHACGPSADLDEVQEMMMLYRVQRLLVLDAPDIVLTDLKMPEMGGLELLRNLRVQGSDAAVVVMTAFGAVDTAVSALRDGAADYLSKPFSMDELISVLERQMERRVSRDERWQRCDRPCARSWDLEPADRRHVSKRHSRTAAVPGFSSPFARASTNPEARSPPPRRSPRNACVSARRPREPFAAGRTSLGPG